MSLLGFISRFNCVHVTDNIADRVSRTIYIRPFKYSQIVCVKRSIRARDR